jgi:hypothetical protein
MGAERGMISVLEGLVKIMLCVYWELRVVGVVENV